MNPKRILITRTDRLGDVVLSTPVIRYFRKKFPDAYIAFMTSPAAKDVVLHNPDLDEVIVLDKAGRHKGIFGMLAMAMALRKKNFDTAVALHPTTRVHVLLFLAGIPRRIGYDRKFGSLLTVRASHAKQEGIFHEAEYNFKLLEAAGFDARGADKRPYVATKEAERDSVDAFLRQNGVRDDYIAIHAGASCPSKRWPAERFARVADELVRFTGFDIVLIGGEETRPLSGIVSRSMKEKPFDLTGKLTVGELAELLRRAKLFVSNDSGPVHVAAAVNCPVVSIFGRKDPGLSPKRWGPVGEKIRVVHKDVGCKKCLAHLCVRHFKCLEAITPRDVVNAAMELVGR